MKKLFTICLSVLFYHGLIAQQVTNGLVASYTFSAGANNLKNQVDPTKSATVPPNATWTNTYSNAQGGYDSEPMDISLAPTPIADRFGNANSAYQFQGGSMPKIDEKNMVFEDVNVSSYLSLPTTNMLKNNYTYSAWIKISGAPGNWSIIVDAGTSGGDQALALTATEIKAHAYVVSGQPPMGFSASSVSYTQLPQADKWVQLTSVRSDTSLAVYLNGQLLNYVKISDTYPTFYGMGSPVINIGCRFDHTFPFTGAIDDVRIYDRALTTSEVKQDYEYGLNNEYSRVASVALASESDNSKLNLYPNPVENVITLESAQNEKIMSVKILRADGTVVYNADEYTSSSIDASELSSGIYIMEVIAENKLYRKKLVKK